MSGVTVKRDVGHIFMAALREVRLSGCVLFAAAKSSEFLAEGFADAGEREALGRLTNASPYSSIKVPNTSLDHLLLGTAAD